MKKLFALFLLITVIASTAKQSAAQALPDSVIKQYNAAETNGDKLTCLNNYLNSFMENDSTWLNKAFGMRAYFTKQKDERGVDYTELLIAGFWNRKKDFATALKLALPVLSKLKMRKDTTGIIFALQKIVLSYERSRNYMDALKYEKERLPIFIVREDTFRLANTYNVIALYYSNSLHIDSAMFYAQMSMKKAKELKNDSLIYYPISTIGEIYLANKEYDLALPFLRKPLQYPPWFNDDECQMSMHTDLAEAFLGMQQYDSTNLHARLVLGRAPYKGAWGKDNFLLRTYKCLYQSFDATKQIDSSNKYFRLHTTFKDSLYGIEKTKNIQEITTREQMHQLALQAEQALTEQDAEDERQKNIQFSVLGIGIISLLILFLLLSQSIAVKPRFVKVFGILGLLITFEFLNLLLHPFLEKITNHSPVLMLLCLVGIAALLIPLHHRLDHWITTKLVEKNERIRLAAAKRIIEEAEKKSTNE